MSKSFVIKIISIYQKILSPDHNNFFEAGFCRCRFYPSCSDYSIFAISQYGLLKGAVLSLNRILRCNPFSRGGYDPLR